MHVVITGGSRGIGAEAVRRFTGLGHAVTFLYEKSTEAAAALSAETGADAVCCDVADEAATARVFAGLGEIDLLIACAGIAYYGVVQDTTEAQWDRIFDVNVKGVFHAVKGVLPSMLGRQQGCILTVSSIWGQIGASCEVPYSATKGAILALTKALAQELGPSHIRVNCVAPGAIRTEMLRDFSGDELDAFRQETPLLSLGTASDVVDAMVYLSEARFVTGQVLGVNGGYVL
ncbi:MAG: SDR family oxidoreductase [Oscillospiraceae bacterium]|nr:SDR family oxidoreductase [Oscillospiraceae bacterium]